MCLGPGEGERGQRLPLRGLSAYSESGNQGRIETCGEKNAHRHVGDEMGANACGERFGGVDRSVAEGDARHGLEDERAVAGDSRPVAGRQGADRLPQAERLRHRSPGEETGDRRRIDFERQAAAGLEGARLRGEAQLPAVERVEERLDAVGVARQDELAGGGVPDRQSVHATQLRQRPRALSAPELEDHFGVGTAVEADAGGREPRRQLAEIVDLAVEDDGEAPVGGGHRLRPGRREVEDREPAVGKQQAAVGRAPEALAVRPAPRERGVNARQLLRVRRRRLGRTTINPADAAHRQPPTSSSTTGWKRRSKARAVNSRS